MRAGRLRGRALTIGDVWEAVGAHGRGLMERAELDEIERHACPGPGTCAGQFTANTMAIALDCLGLAILGDVGHVEDIGVDVHAGQGPDERVGLGDRRLGGLVVRQRDLEPEDGLVALPLELRNMPPEERRKSTTKYINLVGLDGFEDKYVKDLSAGMRRRVEVARSLVTEPEIIFMDEPFGSLDAYTSSILRRDLVKIIEELKGGTTTVIMTTNSLTEAVELGDRVLMLSSKPARLKGEMKIDMERPRSETSKAFMNYYKKAFTLFEKHKATGIEDEELR